MAAKSKDALPHSGRLDEWLSRMREEDKAFYAALGQFMLGWADVERHLGEVLRRYASMSEPVARAILSGTRARTMMNFITAVADNTGASKARRDDLVFLFPKIAALNTQRDRIAHHGSFASPSIAPNSFKRRISNERRSSRMTNEFVQFVDSEEVHRLANECLQVCAALRCHTAPGAFRRYYWQDRPLTKSSAPRGAA